MWIRIAVVVGVCAFVLVVNAGTRRWWERNREKPIIMPNGKVVRIRKYL